MKVKGIGSEEEMVKLWPSSGYLIVIRSYAQFIAGQPKVINPF